MDNKIIAVDFDGTLCENKYPEIVNCPHCENEITMQWSIKESGYKAYCPVCGKRLMLCTACHDDTGVCDYDTKSDDCKFNRKVKRNEHD